MPKSAKGPGDGSVLVGGINTSSVVQGLKVDSSGNLKVTSSGGTASTVSVADANTPANTLKVNADGSLNVNPSSSSSSTAINDGTTTTQKATVDVSGNLQMKLGAALPAGTNVIGHVITDSGNVAVTSLPALPAGTNVIGTVELADSGGTNKLAIDASGRLTLVPNSSVNIAQWAGAAPGVNNPLITQKQIANWINNGQGFSCTTGKQTAGGAITSGFSLFNPNASGKTLLIYSIKVTVGNNSFNQLNYTTVDPALGTAMTIANRKAANGTASIASASFSNTTVTPAGTSNDMFSAASNTLMQVLQNEDNIIIPANNGFALYLNLSGANVWSASAQWIEF